MAIDWDIVAAEVADGILEAGISAEIVRPGLLSGDAYNPTRGTDHVAPCTIVYSEWKYGEVDGDTVRATDRKFIVAASGFTLHADDDGLSANEPSPGDRLRDLVSGREYSILGVWPVAPGGVPLLWKVQCRA